MDLEYGLKQLDICKGDCRDVDSIDDDFSGD